MMLLKRILRKIFRTTTGILLFTAFVLSLTIWFLGPLIGWGDFRPFDDWVNRLIWIGGLFLFTFAIIGLLWWLRRRRERKLEEDIAAAEDEAVAGGTAVDAELAELRGRMREALQTLKRAKLGGRARGGFLYQLPWYLIIGPPAPARPPRSRTPASTCRWRRSSARTPSAASPARATATGGSPTTRC